MRVLLAGPCAVGKTYIAKILVRQLENVQHLDLDEIRKESLKERKGLSSPCSIKFFDLEACLSPALKSCIGKGFVLDVGGDTIFRQNANNDERLKQIIRFKKRYGVSVIILTAEKGILFERFSDSKNRGAEEFGPVWDDWCLYELPYWELCKDRMIDTTPCGLDRVDDLVKSIKEFSG